MSVDKKFGLVLYNDVFPLQTSYDIKNICGCEVIDEKVPARTVFRIVRLSKDGSYKNMDVESGASTASECCLDGVPTFPLIVVYRVLKLSISFSRSNDCFVALPPSLPLFPPPHTPAEEIQRKIALILEGVSSSTRTGYMEWKEQQQTKTRKPSKHM